jgi:hypothetical protein
VLERASHRFIAIAFISILSCRLKRLVVEELGVPELHKQILRPHEGVGIASTFDRLWGCLAESTFQPMSRKELLSQPELTF